MTSLPRYLQSFIEKDLDRKMVFVGGPRQVGKTQLVKMIVQDAAAYLNSPMWAYPLGQGHVHLRGGSICSKQPDL